MSIIKEVLEKLNVPIKREQQGYFSLDCPWREGSNSGAVLLDAKSGKWKDCVAGDFGDFDLFISKVLGRELTEREKKRYKEIEERLEFNEKTPFPLPEKIFSEDNLVGLLANYNYFIGRGLDEETCRKFETGVFHAGPLYNRASFPIRNEQNKIVGFSGRALDNNKFPRWKHVGHSKNFLFPCHLNKQYVLESKQVVLVESPFDVLYLWKFGIRNVFCLFGLNLSKRLLAHIISLNPKYVIISLNNEESKRGYEAANKIKDKLVKFYDMDKVIVCLPPKKDFGECNEAQIGEFKKYLGELKT